MTNYRHLLINDLLIKKFILDITIFVILLKTSPFKYEKRRTYNSSLHNFSYFTILYDKIESSQFQSVFGTDLFFFDMFIKFQYFISVSRKIATPSSSFDKVI